LIAFVAVYRELFETILFLEAITSQAGPAGMNAVLRKVEEGTRVVFIPGNHDEVFRDYCGLNLAGVELLPEAIHETADGREMLVIHGDH